MDFGVPSGGAGLCYGGFPYEPVRKGIPQRLCTWRAAPPSQSRHPSHLTRPSESEKWSLVVFNLSIGMRRAISAGSPSPQAAARPFSRQAQASQQASPEAQRLAGPSSVSAPRPGAHWPCPGPGPGPGAAHLCLKQASTEVRWLQTRPRARPARRARGREQRTGLTRNPGPGPRERP